MSLVTHNAKGEKREIKMRYRQVSREWFDLILYVPSTILQLNTGLNQY